MLDNFAQKGEFLGFGAPKLSFSLNSSTSTFQAELREKNGQISEKV